MATLRHVPAVGENLSKSHTRVIRKLHKLIFGDEGDRKNRKRLRDFAGFQYAENTNEFREKTDWVKQEFTLGDLTSICNVLNIDYVGDEEAIARRICRCLCDLKLLNAEPPDVDESDEEEDAEADGSDREEEPYVPAVDGRIADAEREREVPAQRNVHEPVEPRRTASFALSFRDVEDTIRPFDGRDNYPIETWIEDYEESALLFNWNDMQKLVFAKKSLTGLAKSFVQGERGITSWPQLRRKLLAEFSRKVNSAELHRMLCQRKMKREETVQEYYLIMREIAARGKIDTDALMQYIIDGIPDDLAYNKSILYGATDLRQFKDKLTIFGKLRERTTQAKEVPKPVQRGPQEDKKTVSSSSVSVPQPKKVVLRCYNCNEEGHRASACEKPKRERGSCYTCGSKDHLQRSCPQRSKPGSAGKGASPSAHTDTHFIEPDVIIPCYELPVYFEIGKISAMVDTGSPVSLIIASRVPDKAEMLPSDDNLRFDGVNGSRIQILGRFKQNGYVRGEMIEINFYVVPDGTMKTPCLLGRDFIVRNNLKLSFDNTVTLSKTMDLRLEIAEPSYDIMQIDVCETERSPEIIISPQIDNETQIEVRKLVNDNYVNAPRPEQPIVNMEMEITVQPDHRTFYYHPRRLSYVEKEAAKEIINDLLARKIIRPSNSPYCSPVVMIRKKTGEYRMAVDYRDLNKITLRDNMPIPRIEDQLDELQGKRYFTRLDLKDAFHHVTISEKSIPLTSFVTSVGQFEYTKMPFGLRNGPAFFMRYIRLVFHDLLQRNKILIYMDDILIATESVNENMAILKELLTVMTQNCLELKYSKCIFLATEINYLGYRINAQGISINADNVKAITEYPIPRNFKELESYLGLISYFRKFIKDFALHSKPLYDLKKSKAEFIWNEDCSNSYDYLKKMLMSEPVLSIYNPKAETQLHCDASSHGYGSVILQKQDDGKYHPVCYFSRRTTDAESRYHSFELECLCIIYSLERFRIYLQGICFTIVTDCNSLKLTLEKKEVNPRIMRWSLILRNYDYRLEHRSAERMKHADALSRVYSTMIITENSLEDNLQILQGADETIKILRDRLEKSEDKKFELNNGLVYRKIGNKLLFYVPKSMEDNVIRIGHEQIGHQGINKSVEFISRTYWFPNLKEKVECYLKNCLKCITYSANANKIEGKLHSSEKGKLPFYCLHIDHYGPLERTANRYKYVFEVIDAFTKFVKFFPTVSTGTDEVIKHLTTYFTNYSRPVRIVSDRGSAFTSTKFKEFLQEQGIEHVLIATGTPHANGQIERVNRCLTPMLAKLSRTTRTWNEALANVEFAMNNSVNRATNTTPARLLFGIDQLGQMRDDLRDILSESTEVNREIETLRDEASQNIDKCQKYNENYYDKRHKPPTEYREGDLVMLRNVDVNPGVNKKLIPRFKGPYIVKSVLDNDRYVVKDPENYQCTQIPYEGVASPENMRPWLKP